MNTGGFFGGGFAKDQEIINKKEMVDGWRGSGNFQAFVVSSNLFFEQKSGQNFNTQNEQKREKRISLSKASGKGKKSKTTAIDEDGEREGGDANSNPINPRGVKP